MRNARGWRGRDDARDLWAWRRVVVEAAASPALRGGHSRGDRCPSRSSILVGAVSYGHCGVDQDAARGEERGGGGARAADGGWIGGACSEPGPASGARARSGGTRRGSSLAARPSDKTRRGSARQLPILPSSTKAQKSHGRFPTNSASCPYSVSRGEIGEAGWGAHRPPARWCRPRD